MKKLIVYGFIFLILISVAYARIDAISEEGIEKTYAEDGISYSINATYINDGRVMFLVNNETTDLLYPHDEYKFPDKSIIYVNEVLEEEAAESADKVSFSFWPGICATPYCNFTEQIAEAVQEPEAENITEETDKTKIANETEPTPVVEEIKETEPVKQAKENLFMRIINFILGWFR
jgi:hypothetical protein